MSEELFPVFYFAPISLFSVALSLFHSLSLSISLAISLSLSLPLSLSLSHSLYLSRLNLQALPSISTSGMFIYPIILAFLFALILAVNAFLHAAFDRETRPPQPKQTPLV